MTSSDPLSRLSRDACERYEERYEERAGILEFDGGLPREEAERRALAEVQRNETTDRIRKRMEDAA